MINYEILNNSLNFYQEKGYNRIETPLMVTEAVDTITRPREIEPLHIPNKNKNLIASGEQGFLYLYLKQYITSGKYVTVTPCFRNDAYDFTHSKTFMKTELIIINPDTDKQNDLLKGVINDAREFFHKYFDKKLIQIKKTQEMPFPSFDIEVKIGEEYIELGSYGIRQYKHLKWIYGTGVAEPRLSRLLKELSFQIERGENEMDGGE
jgi:aspartyl/asparaginyl-tRNA synthetase